MILAKIWGTGGGAQKKPELRMVSSKSLEFAYWSDVNRKRGKFRLFGFSQPCIIDAWDVGQRAIFFFSR